MDIDRIAALERAVVELGQYVYDLALLAEQSGVAIADLRRRPNVVVVNVTVDGSGGWSDVTTSTGCFLLESGGPNA